jgi:uncharacterized membrane protein YgaE (UPF0421/DUF939 family)
MSETLAATLAAGVASVVLSALAPDPWGLFGVVLIWAAYLWSLDTFES